MFLLLLFLMSLFLQKTTASIEDNNNNGSPVDCTFERRKENDALGFCGWRPDNIDGVRIWHTGNAVLVDSVNSVVRSSNEGDRFAFVQGRYGAPTEGLLRSPLVHYPDGPRLLSLNYWKASVSPSLDICLEKNQTELLLRCVDTIQGPGQQQWVRRLTLLPNENQPYRIVLRARNLLAAEDIIGVDDIKIQLADNTEESMEISRSAIINNIEGSMMPLTTTTTPFGTSSHAAVMGIPKNPFDGIDEIQNATIPIAKEILSQQQQIPVQRDVIHQTKIFPASIAAHHLASLTSSKSSETFTRTQDKKRKKLPQQQQPQLDYKQTPVQPLIRPQIRLAPISQQQQQQNDDMIGEVDNTHHRIGSSTSQQSLINSFRDTILSTSPKRVVVSGVAGSPFPAVTGGVGIGGFPPFPFGSTIFTAPTPATQPERSARCSAVTCTFMDGTCNWKLGSAWHSTSHGSASIESPATRSDMISAEFKPPVASYVDFDLWMSDDASLTVSEQIMDNSVVNLGSFTMSDNVDNGDAGMELDMGANANKIQLFTRNGATDGGWHRFRVPLRPSFMPVRLLFLANLSVSSNTFISLSNIRLVNGDGTEIGCESMDLPENNNKNNNEEREEEKAKNRALLEDIGLEWLSKQPAPLQLPPALGTLLATAQFPSPPPFHPSKFGLDGRSNKGEFSPEPAFTLSPQIRQPNLKKPYKQQQHFTSAPKESIPFNPLKPMLEGIMPIIPLRGNPLRLTALMEDGAPIHQHKNIDFPKLISHLAIPSSTLPSKSRSSVDDNKNFGQLANNDYSENHSKDKKENGSGTENKHVSKQLLYGATPIPTSQKHYEEADEEMLLPFGAKKNNDRIEKSNRNKESVDQSQLTVFPSRKRNRNNNNNNNNSDNEEAGHTMKIEQGQHQNEEELAGLNSVTSVLSSSHHRGWVERADDTSALEFKRHRNRLRKR